MRSLPELQRAFLAAIAPSGDASAESRPTGIETEIRGDHRLGAADRLAVYARMYVARLIDVLREDYPRVAAVVGAERFMALARAYVARHPSAHPSLRGFGQHFPDFLARDDGAEGPHEFIADLARLEWARLDVFDAADARPLAIEALKGVSPEAWPALRFRFVPAVTVLEVGWPVHRIWQASEHGAPAGIWRAETTWLRVWREDARVFQAAMDRLERVAFAHVEAGDDFGTLCAGLAAVVSAESAAETAGAIVLRWIADGILTELSPNGD